MKRLLLPFAVAAAFLPAAVSAHFQLVYPSKTIVSSAGDVPLSLVFWHPMANGEAMDMDAPEEFFVQHRGQRTSLLADLEEATFKHASINADAYITALPVKRSGDYVLALTPAPYFEAGEDKYIQQITKSFVNRLGLPTDWNQELGLPTEILPLVKPYNVIAGSTFTGRVLRDGQPVPGAEIEVEFLPVELVQGAADNTIRPADSTAAEMPGGALVIYADEDGEFTFGIPRAGQWGFAALGSGPDTEHDGKELSQDAVIWITAHDLP